MRIVSVPLADSSGKQTLRLTVPLDRDHLHRMFDIRSAGIGGVEDPVDPVLSRGHLDHEILHQAQVTGAGDGELVL